MRKIKAFWRGAIWVNFSVHECQRWCKGSVLFYLFSLHLSLALARSQLRLRHLMALIQQALIIGLIELLQQQRWFCIVD